MRIFKNLVEAYKEVERDLMEMGISVQSDTVQDRSVHNDPLFSSIELYGYCYTITNTDIAEHVPQALTHFGHSEPSDLAWLKEEFTERVSSFLLNPGHAWEHQKDFWSKYIHDNKFAYTYNERIRAQLPRVKQELVINPNTRQAIITVYDKHDDIDSWGGRKRVPCSLSYHFMRRDEKLNMIYTMRSCDLLNHYIYDVILAIMLQRHVAEAINVEPGHFIHFFGSLHAFKGDMILRGIF